ncbi:MAG TPA: hypothetical protein VFI46_00260 [Jiangellaceae bacterium]|nr:hypothetical protein [Jiangellaceae bacterium]
MRVRRSGSAAASGRGTRPAHRDPLAVNVVIFTWLYLPVMVAAEFMIIVFTLLAASIIRSTCCNRRPIQ